MNEGLIAENPLTGIVVESRRSVVPDSVDYLSDQEVELLLTCAKCADDPRLPVSDFELLANCPHMPFEKRVAFTLATHQCPRAGELAAMDWSRIDLRREVWHVAKSWDGPTKNGKTRTQALLPRSLRALRVWHQLGGKPTSGLLFPSPYKGASGAQKRYAYGYDWGWADSPSTVQGLRPGWWRRVGITTKVRFHDMRDTAATHLLSGTWGPKWPIKEVSEHLGHSSVKVTEDRYAHLTIEAKVATARATESERKHRAAIFCRVF